MRITIAYMWGSPHMEWLCAALGCIWAPAWAVYILILERHEAGEDDDAPEIWPVEANPIHRVHNAVTVVTEDEIDIFRKKTASAEVDTVSGATGAADESQAHADSIETRRRTC